MGSSFDKLTKILSLEQQQGYRNKAVIGGLDKFVAEWGPSAQTQARNRQQAALIYEMVALLTGYPTVEERTGRERIISEVLNKIQRFQAVEGESAPSTTPTDRPRAPSERTVQAPRPAAPDEKRPGEQMGTDGEAGARSQQRPSRQEPRPESSTRREALIASSSTRPLPPKRSSEVDRPDPGQRPANMERPPGPQPGHRDDPPPQSAPVLVEPDSPASAKATAPQAVAPASDDESMMETEMAIEPPPATTNGESPEAEDDDVDATRPAEAPHPWPKSSLTLPPIPAGLGLDAHVQRLPSVGPQYAKYLEHLGVSRVRDLLWLFPRRYDDYSALKTIDQLVPGEEVTVIGNVWDIKERRARGGIVVLQLVISDSTGSLTATFFNQQWLAKQFKQGKPIVLSGKVDQYMGRLTMNSPEWEALDEELIHTGRMVPVYPLTRGIGQKWLRKLIKQTLDAWAERVPDPLPLYLRRRTNLVDLTTALIQIHFPESAAALADAQHRLGFDELLAIQLGVESQRQAWQANPAPVLFSDDAMLQKFTGALPFQMTGAQRRAVADIRTDLLRGRPMSRLLQGDVGSGKTAIAATALWLAICNLSQGALMAPTEILAEQHARNLGRLFANLQTPDGRPVRLALLTGRTRAAERNEILSGLAGGQVDILVGTHAVIQERVNFKHLTLAIIDEQHRFGVAQRGALRQKGVQPHLLVMTATPIPRTLALTLYGDLDLSILDELPPGRQPIPTRWLKPAQRERAYSFVRARVAEGRQVFIICPLVEETEMSANTETKAAVEEYQRLQTEVFPDLKLGLLHGRLKGDEKDAVMQAFSRGETQILVSTSVVEVGIDVPNATAILIEGAEKFGLAQLHQLRGRVGRGEHKSYCLLLSTVEGGPSAERLLALEQSQDGFFLAEKDLELRGPGEYFGTRQSGLPALRMARLSDVRLLEQARWEAQVLFSADPDLSEPEHQALAQKVHEFWQSREQEGLLPD